MRQFPERPQAETYNVFLANTGPAYQPWDRSAADTMSSSDPTQSVDGRSTGQHAIEPVEAADSLGGEVLAATATAENRKDGISDRLLTTARQAGSRLLARYQQARGWFVESGWQLYPVKYEALEDEAWSPEALRARVDEEQRIQHVVETPTGPLEIITAGVTWPADSSEEASIHDAQTQPYPAISIVSVTTEAANAPSSSASGHETQAFDAAGAPYDGDPSTPGLVALGISPRELHELLGKNGEHDIVAAYALHAAQIAFKAALQRAHNGAWPEVGFSDDEAIKAVIASMASLAPHDENSSWKLQGGLQLEDALHYHWTTIAHDQAYEAALEAYRQGNVHLELDPNGVRRLHAIDERLAAYRGLYDAQQEDSGLRQELGLRFVENVRLLIGDLANERNGLISDLAGLPHGVMDDYKRSRPLFVQEDIAWLHDYTGSMDDVGFLFKRRGEFRNAVDGQIDDADSQANDHFPVDILADVYDSMCNDCGLENVQAAGLLQLLAAYWNGDYDTLLERRHEHARQAEISLTDTDEPSLLELVWTEYGRQMNELTEDGEFYNVTAQRLVRDALADQFGSEVVAAALRYGDLRASTDGAELQANGEAVPRYDRADRHDDTAQVNNHMGTPEQFVSGFSAKDIDQAVLDNILHPYLGTIVANALEITARDQAYPQGRMNIRLFSNRVSRLAVADDYTQRLSNPDNDPRWQHIYDRGLRRIEAERQWLLAHLIESVEMAEI